MKSNYFRHLWDNVCSKNIFLLFYKTRQFYFDVKKKTISNKLDPDMSIVFSNNESKVPARKNLGWVRGDFS